MDLCEKKRSNQGANYGREDHLVLKVKEEGHIAKGADQRRGIEIPSSSPIPF